jgi:hypothetical protein
MSAPAPFSMDSRQTKDVVANCDVDAAIDAFRANTLKESMSIF